MVNQIYSALVNGSSLLWFFILAI